MSAAACTVAGEPDSVAQARHWVRGVLRTAGCEDRLVAHAVAVTSELVTNALKYTASGHPKGTVRIEVLTGTCRVRVSVIDAGTESSAPTVPRSCPDPDVVEAPRGLYLIDQWAERLVVQGDERGRTLSADLAPPTSADGAASGPPTELPRRTRRARPVGDEERRTP